MTKWILLLKQDHLLSFEARIKNQGKLPVTIEEDLSIESGNLQVYLTKPGGKEKVYNHFWMSSSMDQCLILKNLTKFCVQNNRSSGLLFAQFMVAIASRGLFILLAEKKAWTVTVSL